MKKIKIDYEDLKFIYAYFRYIDLSLDRSRWNLRLEAKSFFSDKLQSADVLNYLTQKYGIPQINIDWGNYIVPYKGRIFLKKIFNLYLYEVEILYVYKVLKTFGQYLHLNIKNDNTTIEKLRLDAAILNSHILEAKISNKDLRQLMKVEHFKAANKDETIDLHCFYPKNFKEKILNQQ